MENTKLAHDSAAAADLADIQELESKIDQFRSGQLQEDRFKHYRLTRGVYGQRQLGVQMFRTKLPYGKVTSHQLEVLAELAEKYGNNNLHITTRQNIQLHYVKLEDSVEVWKGLAGAGLTARGACGNTVRNITASATAGIDPNEPFDVTPYVQATYEYFLRYAVGQDMGRKIKIAFSSSEDDSGFTYFHDLGFIATQKKIGDKLVDGFKVVAGGGLGAQSIVAPVVSDFMVAKSIIPFIDASLRIFDRYGEREKRHKARMKFLIKEWGIDKFSEAVESEIKTVPDFEIDFENGTSPTLPSFDFSDDLNFDKRDFEIWKKSNVFKQKQPGFYGVYLKIHLGDLSPGTARSLAEIVRKTAANDIRFTVQQNILLRFVTGEVLPYLYQGLQEIGLAKPGHATIADITACPGTDTCALGVTNSTGLATELNAMLEKEYPGLLSTEDITVKISGCMNSCGQHMAAAIGFHGSSIKREGKVIPAMQVVMGGGIEKSIGVGYVADRVIKLPTKRIPEALRILLQDYASNSSAESNYLAYYRNKGKIYFYDLLKKLAVKDSVEENEYFDWGQDRKYIQSIGVGECAGASYDMVGAILGDAIEKLDEADKSYRSHSWAETVYHAYTSMIIAAKGWLLTQDIKCNTHIGIIEDFESNFAQSPDFTLPKPFSRMVLQIRDHAPSEQFASQYLSTAKNFVNKIIESRTVSSESDEKLVINDYYKA